MFEFIKSLFCDHKYLSYTRHEMWRTHIYHHVCQKCGNWYNSNEPPLRGQVWWDKE